MGFLYAKHDLICMSHMAFHRIEPRGKWTPLKGIIHKLPFIMDKVENSPEIQFWSGAYKGAGRLVQLVRYSGIVRRKAHVIGSYP